MNLMENGPNRFVID